MFAACFFSAVFILMAAGVCGCFPGNENHQDEERDPHFQRGRDLANCQEYKAAAEEFEKALETNPRSAAAHYELGCLCDNNLKDYAAAIYHYERLLALPRLPARGPGAGTHSRLQIGTGRHRIPAAQQPESPARGLALTEENRLLKQQLDEARNHPGASLSPLPAPVPAAAPAPAQPPRLANNPIPAPNLNPNPNLNLHSDLPPMSPHRFRPGTAPPRPVSQGRRDASHPRTYVIQPKDSIYSVAARYGLKAGEVLAANPNVSPTHLRIGQNLNLP